MSINTIIATYIARPPSLAEYKKRHPSLSSGTDIYCFSCGKKKQKGWKQKNGKTIHRCSRCNKPLYWT